MARVPNIALTSIACLMLAAQASAQTNIDATNKFAWSENAGYLNFRDANGGTQGVRVSSSYLQGFVWGENIGWINTGNGGAPYANTNNTNFGVNIDPATGNLSGLAWGENVGWINFNTAPAIGSQAARFDLATGRFSGYAWGENIGWINLNDSTKFVAASVVCCLGNADKLAPGQVNFADITSTLSNFGDSYGLGTGVGDANCDGQVNFADVTSILVNFVLSCP